MTALLNFIQSIADGVLGAIDFLAGMIADIAYMAQLTAETIAKVPSYFVWMPPEVLAIIGTILAIVVVYKILGRD